MVSGQPVQLVAAARHRHPPVESLVADLGDLAADPLDRPQGPPDHDPGRPADHQQHQRQPDQEQRHEGLRRLVDVLERRRDADDVLVAGRLGLDDVALVAARQVTSPSSEVGSGR